MPLPQLHERPAHELAAMLRDRSLSSVELIDYTLARIEALNERLGAYLHIDADGARAQARRSDERRARGELLSVFDGVPLGLKDIFLTEGLPTTCSSLILEGFVAPYDGTVVRKLKDAGAILIGKLSMDEFAMGGSNEWCAYRTPRNPWNQDYVPGGSSGGSAIAVSAGLAAIALGTDTGGSIRQPAAFTGIVGMKPTYGRVSRFGVVAFASSLDQVGPMARDVRDCAALLGTIAGHDPQDSTSVTTDVPQYTDVLDRNVEITKLGIPREYCSDHVDSDVLRALEEAADAYRKLGVEVVDIALPLTDYAIAAYYLINTSEASSNLARFDGVRYGRRVDPGKGLVEMYCESRGQGFGPEVKRRIMLGTYALSAGYYDAYYAKALKVRTLVRREFARAFSEVDLILSPTTPTPAFKVGANTDDPLSMYLTDQFTVSANLAGLPAISFPGGMSRKGLPIGIQLVGPEWSEERLLQTAYAFERHHDYHLRRPSL